MRPLQNTGRRLPAVALAELVNLLRGLQDVLLTGVKRVRLARNLQFQQWVFVAVFPLDGIPGGRGRFRQDREIGRNILENDVSVFGMYALFHLLWLRVLA